MSDDWIIWREGQYRTADTREAAIQEAANWKVYSDEDWTEIDAIEGPGGELVDLETELVPVIAEADAAQDRWYEKQRERYPEVLLHVRDPYGDWGRGCIHYDTPKFREEYARVLARLGADRVRLKPWRRACGVG